MDIKIFDEVLNTFENEDIKRFAKKCLEKAPDYWWHVPASSTGKYHPPYSLGEGGLVRHTIAVTKFLNHMFGVEAISNRFTSRERDLLKVAAIVHDMFKSGTQENYDKSKWTRFDHPIFAANFVRMFDDDLVNQKEKEFIAHAIESHMGEWNTDKRYPNVVLPKPHDMFQVILHLADYLASRKDIEMNFDSVETKQQELPNVDTWKMDFGKYKGLTLSEIKSQHPDYIAWIQNQDGFNREPCKSLLISMGYKFKE